MLPFLAPVPVQTRLKFSDQSIGLLHTSGKSILAEKDHKLYEFLYAALSMNAPPVAFVGGFYGRMPSTTPGQTRMGFGHCFTRESSL